MDELQFAFAKPEDEESIKELLAEYELPIADVARHLDHFIVARSNDKIVGTVGLEVLGELGLLRSLAVAHSFLSKGLGQMLYERIQGHALEQGVKELYLLTTTAEAYFAKQGFYRVGSDAVPALIRSTEEFTSLCPSTAVIMSRKLP